MSPEARRRTAATLVVATALLLFVASLVGYLRFALLVSAVSRLTEETPYTFKRTALLTDPADLPASCKANRGPARAPLFLVNHWVSPDRRIRHHLPNLLAVNFYAQGDLLRVVDKLNGVG